MNVFNICREEMRSQFETQGHAAYVYMIYTE